MRQQDPAAQEAEQRRHRNPHPHATLEDFHIQCLSMIELNKGCSIHPGWLFVEGELAKIAVRDENIPVLVDDDDAALLQGLDERLVLLDNLGGLVELRLQAAHLLLQLLDVGGGAGRVGGRGIPRRGGGRAGRALQRDGVLVGEGVHPDGEDAEADHGGDDQGSQDGGKMFLHGYVPS